MCFFRKKKIEKKEEKIENLKNSQVLFERLDIASDQVLTKLATDIKTGIPVIINFDLLDIDEANKAVAFLSGVVYAIDGEIYAFNNSKNLLFGDSKLYNDGSIKKLINEIEG